MNPIISAKDLKEIIAKGGNPVVLDARTGKDAQSNYLQEHLKGAFFIHLDQDLAGIGEDAAQGGRHPLPRLGTFAKKLSSLGLTPEAQVVVYDTSNGANAAARCWWMLKAAGVEKAQVLNGGLQAAKEEGLAMASGHETAESQPFSAPENWLLPTISIDEVEKGLSDGSITVIDVRDAYRYRGESEPIDLLAGHIPGAINIPFSENLDDRGHFLPPSDLKTKYSELLNGRPEPIVVHCGSGVTACHTILVLASAGLPVPKLYVGSWSEWSRRGKPIATEI